MHVVAREIAAPRAEPWTIGCRLHRVGDAWRVVDIVTSGTSLVRFLSRRVDRALRDEGDGWDALLGALRDGGDHADRRALASGSASPDHGAMTRASLLFVIGALLACLSIGCGCYSFQTYRDYVVSDAEIATVLAGGTTPSASGCRAVCNDRHCREVGVFGDAGFSCGGPVLGCNVTDHTLTCAFEGRAC